MSLRRSNRIYEIGERKYIEAKKQMVVLANKNKSTSNISEKANNIKEMYKLVYANKELFHTYAKEEYNVVFMRTYIESGYKVLEEPVPKGIVRMIKPTIMKAIKYAEKYLQERGLLVRRALYKCEKNTCYNAVCLVYSYL
jgi:hypothetical protein